MLAVSVDGNRTQYRFRQSQRIDEPLFKGPFIMEDSAVTDFVDKAHSTKCEIVWSGRHLEGAGSTAGEEVEMVNGFLSRCAITTKYMTTSARNDMLTVHATTC
ncbi:hypothetical protein CgunFtcFv8_026230 [Champsocephalus gunnari]|uniref:Uncharacterized protein n=1 Tax=Champsocephalus gunnari TaxID=52237 RepID=A0AAN8CCU7_CHAGU|nr:hypothetical protein CgunFtcFv8_026230 [Champsocephalus gunnari]